ncbi:hypothetical protein, partial [Pseudomonas paraeruginosa]
KETKPGTRIDVGRGGPHGGKPPAEDGHLRHWLKRRTGGTPACILPKGLRNPQPLLDTLPDLCSVWPLPHQWWMSMLKTEHTQPPFKCGWPGLMPDHPSSD